MMMTWRSEQLQLEIWRPRNFELNMNASQTPAAGSRASLGLEGHQRPGGNDMEE